jgi:serine protease
MQALEGVMAGARTRVSWRVWWRALAAWMPALALLVATGVAPAAETTLQRVAVNRLAAADVDDDGNARVIVKYRAGSSLAQRRQGAQHLGRQLQLSLQDGHVLGARIQSLRGRGIGAQALAARLAADPDVEWAQPVRRKSIQAVPPNDPFFADGQTSPMPAVGQWYLRAPDTTLVSAVNAVGAWDITTGSASITVAVLDTGVRYDHPDLLPVSASQPGGKLWPGYDFVRALISNDGSGPDSDANDPGDWRSGCSTSSSSWHGTQVAGLIGAATDNGIGIAGTGRNTMVLPVRVLGKCGNGYDDDIIAGMRWAGGLANAAGCTSGSGVSATCNPHPARVINMSLGSSETCSDAYRAAMAELTAAGVVVVVASGNDTGRAVNAPANCPGALAVAGLRHAGTKVGYSNLGPQVAIAAPAGNCVNAAPGACLYPLVTTSDAGTSTPVASTYSTGSVDDASLGTSFATPIVAGSVALMLAVNPALTPAEVKTALQATARPFPTVGAQENGTQACEAAGDFDQVECYCTTSTCGAGLLDAGAAVARVAGRPFAALPVFRTAIDTPTAGMQVAIDSGPSGVGVVGRRWELVSGSAFASLDGAANALFATLVTRLPGTAVVRLTGTNAAGESVSLDRSITIKAGPTAALRVSSPRSSKGAVLALDASASVASPGRTITAYAWTLSGKTPGRFTTATSDPTASTASLATDTIGADLTVEVTVTDSAGDSHRTTQTLAVLAAPTAKASVSDAAPQAGAAVGLDGSASLAAPGLRVSAYRWSVVSGASFVQLADSANAALATLNAVAAGTAVVRLTVTDSAGATATSDLTITVKPAQVVVTPPTTPTTSSGGGGAMGAGWLLGLAAAVLLLWRTAPRSVSGRR